MSRPHALPGRPENSLARADLRRYDIGRIEPQSAHAKEFPLQLAADGERFPTLRAK
jgi:glycerophosphoryl diester phosphodiesterase